MGFQFNRPNSTAAPTRDARHAPAVAVVEEEVPGDEPPAEGDTNWIQTVDVTPIMLTLYGSTGATITDLSAADAASVNAAVSAYVTARLGTYFWSYKWKGAAFEEVALDPRGRGPLTLWGRAVFHGAGAEPQAPFLDILLANALGDRDGLAALRAAVLALPRRPPIARFDLLEPVLVRDVGAPTSAAAAQEPDEAGGGAAFVVGAGVGVLATAAAVAGMLYLRRRETRHPISRKITPDLSHSSEGSHGARSEPDSESDITMTDVGSTVTKWDRGTGDGLTVWLEQDAARVPCPSVAGMSQGYSLAESKMFPSNRSRGSEHTQDTKEQMRSFVDEVLEGDGESRRDDFTSMVAYATGDTHVDAALEETEGDASEDASSEDLLFDLSFEGGGNPVTLALALLDRPSLPNQIEDAHEMEEEASLASSDASIEVSLEDLIGSYATGDPPPRGEGPLRHLPQDSDHRV